MAQASSHGIPDLDWLTGFAADPARYAAYAQMVEAVFEFAPPPARHPSMWTQIAAFDGAGRCIAGADAGRLTLLVDGVERDAGTIRFVGVVEEHRGTGLFRALMERFFRWAEERRLGPLFLYAEYPELYRRFGFADTAEHAFAGPAPAAVASTAARPLDPVGDRSFIEACLAARAPVSNQLAVAAGAPELFLDRAFEAELAYLPDAGAVIAYEAEGDTLHLHDVVAATIPSLPAILGALPGRFAGVRVMFPPDRLGWSGSPEPEDTGLMVRGDLPAAMRQPFMLPPTAWC